MPLGCGQLPRAGGGPPAASAPTRPPLEVAVPGYFYQPGPAYRQLAQNVPAVGVVVANVDNGAGAAVSPAWASATQSAHRAGITVLGYVDTGYLGTTGNTTRGPSSSQSRQAWMAQVEHDVDTWYRFYGPTVGGVFLDQVQESCGPAARDPELAEAETAREHVIHEPATAAVLQSDLAGADGLEAGGEELATEDELEFPDSEEPPAQEDPVQPEGPDSDDFKQLSFFP